jgi:hypothetical protein
MVKFFSKRAQIPGGLPGAGGEKGEIGEELKGYEAKEHQEEIESLQKEIETYSEELDKIHQFIAQYSQRTGRDLEKEAEGVAAEATVVGAVGGAMEQALATNDIRTAVQVIAGLIKSEKGLKKKITELNKRLQELGAQPVSVPGLGGGLFGGGGGMGMPHISSKTAGKLFKVILIIALILVGVFYALFTTSGSLATSSGGALFADLKNVLRPGTAQLNIATQVLTGRYDPTQLWSSKNYEDRYTAVTDVGVEITDVKSLRDVYIEGSGTEMTIVGTLKVQDLPEDPETKLRQGVTVTISADWDGNFIGAIEEHLTEIAQRLNSQTITTPSKDWTCTVIPRKVERFIGRFQCSTLGAYTLLQEIETHSATLKVKYDFKVVGGKSVYVANFEELSRLMLEDKDPASYYQLTSDEMRSWQTKAPIDIGIGVLGEKEIIGSNNEANPTPYYLGVNVRNMGDGKATVHTITLWVPQEVVPQDGSDFIFAAVDEPCNDDSGTTLCEYTVDFNEILEPGQTTTKFLKFMVPDDIFLKGAPIQSFFAFTSADFGYEIIRTVPIKIRQEVGTQQSALPI